MVGASRPDHPPNGQAFPTPVGAPCVACVACVSSPLPKTALFRAYPGAEAPMVRRSTSTPVRWHRRHGKRVLVIDFTYMDQYGMQRRYRRDASVQTMAAAKAEARRLQVLAVTTGTLETKKRAPTVREFVNGQFAHLFMGRYRESTRRRYEGILRQGLLDELGRKHLDEIRPADARALAATLTARGVQVKPHITLLKTILAAALEVGIIEQIPKLPRLFKQSRKLPACPTRDEVETMLASATGWMKTAVALAALAGLRMGEVRALEVQDVDLEQGVLRIRRALSESTTTTPKSGHDRVIPMTPELHAVLEVAVRDRLPRARLVATAIGTTPSRTYVLRKFKALQRRLELPGWFFHSLRHYFISQLVRHGGSLEAVRIIAGHSKLDVTQRYVHADAGDLREAVSALDGSRPRTVPGSSLWKAEPRGPTGGDEGLSSWGGNQDANRLW